MTSYDDLITTLEKALAIAKSLSPTGTPAASVASPFPIDMIEKLGPSAHRHLLLIEQNGSISMAESLDIRRELSGDNVQSTANQFGRKKDQALFYRDVPDYGMKIKPDQLVKLTSRGQDIAKAYRDLHGLSS